MREQVRKTQEEKRLAMKNLDKQRSEVFQAFKKQSQLVENLKKQKVCKLFSLKSYFARVTLADCEHIFQACLEASLEIKFIEDDFTRLLEWKPDKV